MRYRTTQSLVCFVFAVVAFSSLKLARCDETSTTGQSTRPLDDIQKRGLAIYQKQCVSCHGKNGEGVVGKHPEPLVGDASQAELTKLITETMPKEDSDACVGQDAAAVSAYIYESFYSRAAQVRNRPPRIGLARLTGTQLRHSVADLYAHFEGVAASTKEQGLRGLYFDGARFKNENKKIDRVDAAVNFDFKNDGPGSGINAKDFFIQWQGGIKADVTGRYTFVIRSTCAFVCNFGRNEREFINNHVQSGDQVEFRRAITLTAGRVYPIRIDFYQRTRKTTQPPAVVSLSWIPPDGVEQIVPDRNLVPTSAPGTFSLQAQLPADDRSYGYERGIAVDQPWDESTTAAAVEFADIAVAELWPRYRRNQRGPENGRAKLRNFLAEIAEVAFRGSFDSDARKFYVDTQVDATEDDTEAIKRSVLACLKSPRFLYPLLDSEQGHSRRAANRLALTLFDSLPSDPWLLQEVRSNSLTTPDQVRAAANRMVSDYRTHGKTRELMYAWLNLGHVGEIKKDDAAFPGFDAEVVADLRASFDTFLDDVVWSEASDYREFFKADWVYTNHRLATFYNDATWKPTSPTNDSALAKSESDADHRAGILTHPFLMSELAYRDSTSPVHRGVFLIRYLLGRTLRPPNEAFSPLSPTLHPSLTTRERVELQTSPANCQVCHTKINGLGFTLENYDAVGRYREQERDKPINSAGRYTTRSGKLVNFENTHDLAEFLATGDDAHEAFVARAFQHFVKQPIAAYGPDRLAQLTQTFKQNNFNIRELLVEIAVIAATQLDNLPTKSDQPGT